MLPFDEGSFPASLSSDRAKAGNSGGAGPEDDRVIFLLSSHDKAPFS
jgi:hypothetical protein